MPELSDLSTRVSCPLCGAFVDPGGERVRFQWGGVPTSYKPRDPLRWFRDKSGAIIEPFRPIVTSRFGLFPKVQFNFGDPSCTDLIVFETDPNISEYCCKSCGRPLEAEAVEIHGGIIERAVAFAPGEVQHRFGVPRSFADVIVFRDGVPEPHPEWNDPPFVTDDE